MSSSSIDVNRILQVQSRDVTNDGTVVQEKHPKFSMNMKNYYSIYLKLLHNVGEERLPDLFMLSPECQIKILEENLNILSKKSSRRSDFQIKCDSYSVKPSSKDSILSVRNIPSLTFRSVLKDETRVQVKASSRFYDDSRNLEDTVVIDSTKINVSHVHQQQRLVNKSPPLILPTSTNNAFNKDQNQNISLLQKIPQQNNTNDLLKQHTEDKTDDDLQKINDTDNQFEFTVGEENIVSFICSPPPTRKKLISSNGNQNSGENHEEEDLGFSERDSLMDSVSISSGKSPKTTNKVRKDKVSVSDKVPRTNKSFWHPPVSSSYFGPSSSNKHFTYNCYSNLLSNESGSKECINFQGSIESVCSVSNDCTNKSSACQGTILFREASLRGCYNVESIIKDRIPPMQEVEQEINNVKEAIYSSVRLKRDDEFVVPDCILSILDISKAWLKLNSHFERKDFRGFLEENDIDCSIFSDFAQWQFVSRIFIEKLINMLRKLSLRKNCNNNYTKHRSNPESKQGHRLGGLYHSQDTNSVNPVINSPSRRENIPILNKNEAHGKNWKQTRYRSDQRDPEMITKSKRLCKSKLTVCSSFDNIHSVNSNGAEVYFGQGDSFTREFYFSNLDSGPNVKSFQVLQDPNYGENNFKQQNVFATRLFDKTVRTATAKSCGTRGEINIFPVGTPNYLCTPVTNLLDLPVSGHLSVNTQQIFTTVPPIFSNQPQVSPILLTNPSQYQNNFSQALNMPNPIQCTDLDGGENNQKSKYMKPGSYNFPHKPSQFIKVVNNNFHIENIPDVGVPFLYPASQSNHQPSDNLLESSKSFSLIQVAKDNNIVSSSDNPWKCAVTVSESMRDNVTTNESNEVYKCNLVDTTCSKPHFLLLDDSSIDSSSSSSSAPSHNSDIKDRSPSITSICSSINVSPNKEFPNSPCYPKPSDLSVKSLNMIVLNNETLTNEIRDDGNTFSMNVIHNNEGLKNQNIDNHSSSSRNILNNNNTPDLRNNRPDNEEENALKAPYIDNSSITTQNKQMRDSCNTNFDFKSALLYRKPKTVFKRTITKQITCQLEDILNCIWDAKVSTLVKKEIKSQKEITKLELKVRSPWHLHSIKCKLSKNTYDSLDQALSDFHQYFVDIRNRNKGDKQCNEIVGALEKLFFNLVEKHFGLTYQPTPQCVNQLGLTPSIKQRRSKKLSRRS